MRTLAIVIALIATSSAVARAQAPVSAPSTDRNRATHFSAADLQAAMAKLPGDRPSSSVRVFTLAPYNVGDERRLPQAQGASQHADRAELFYVIEGSGAMLTGGSIPDGKVNGVNTQGTGIAKGTRIAFNTGDFIMVPSGVPHQFVDLTAAVRVMSIYLPDAK